MEGTVYKLKPCIQVQAAYFSFQMLQGITPNEASPSPANPLRMRANTLLALQCWWVACVVGLASLPSSQAKVKYPSWRGPDTFFGGTLPSIRSRHGFTSCDNGMIYSFGGRNKQGEFAP